MEILHQIHQFNLPELNLKNGFAALFIFIIYWINSFLVNLKLINTIMKLFNVQKWIRATQQQKYQYNSDVLSLIHGTQAFLLSLIAIFLSCDKFDSNIYNDQKCLNNPQNKVFYIQIFSLAFLLVDAGIMSYRKSQSSLDKQLYFHHALGIIGILCGIFIGGLVLQITLIQLTSELSTIFTNLRTILLFHNQEDKQIYVFNGIFLLISFFLTRVLVITYSIYKILIPYILINLNFLHILMFSGYFMLYFLNLYWFNKILVKFFNVIKGNKKE